MQRLAVGLAGGLLWAAAATSAQQPAPAPAPALGLVIEEASGRFGEAYTGSEVSHTFAVRNDGAKPVRVVEVSPNTAPTRVDALPGPIPPGGRAEVTVHQGTAGRLGVVTYRFVLKTDDGQPERYVALSGFLQSAFDPDQPILQGQTGPGGVIELALASREVDRFAILDVKDAPAFLAIEARNGGEGGVLLRAKVGADAPLGLHTGTMQLKTSVPQQPLLSVPYRLSVFEDVSPEDVPVDLGTVRQGQPFEKKTRLRSRSGQAFDVTAIEGAPDGMTVEPVPCAEPSPSCTTLVFKSAGAGPNGRLAGAVRVKLRQGRDLWVPYSGIQVGANTVVRDLGRVGDPGPATVAAEGATRLPFKQPTPPPVPPPVTGRPGERVATLKWDANQEEQAYGFLIYRADRPEGPFRRVNQAIVPVSDAPPPHRYTYEDRGVEPGRSYYYYLESVSKGGLKARLSGVVTKVIPPAQ